MVFNTVEGLSTVADQQGINFVVSFKNDGSNVKVHAFTIYYENLCSRTTWPVVGNPVFTIVHIYGDDDN